MNQAKLFLFFFFLLLNSAQLFSAADDNQSNDKTLIFTEENLTKAFKDYSTQGDIILYLRGGVKPTSKHLQLALERNLTAGRNRAELIQQLIDFKAIPDEKNLRYALTRGYPNEIIIAALAKAGNLNRREIENKITIETKKRNAEYELSIYPKRNTETSRRTQEKEERDRLQQEQEEKKAQKKEKKRVQLQRVEDDRKRIQDQNNHSQTSSMLIGGTIFITLGALFGGYKIYQIMKEKDKKHKKLQAQLKAQVEKDKILEQLKKTSALSQLPNKEQEAQNKLIGQTAVAL